MGLLYRRLNSTQFQSLLNRRQSEILPAYIIYQKSRKIMYINGSEKQAPWGFTQPCDGGAVVESSDKAFSLIERNS